MNVVFKHGDAAAGFGEPAVISIAGVSKSFAPGKPVFSGISFDIAPRSVVALIGANGAGKSTLLRCIPRLIEPDSGHIHVLGTDVLNSRRNLRSLRACAP